MLESCTLCLQKKVLTPIGHSPRSFVIILSTRHCQMEERIKYLFRQYLENTCSRKEYEEFFSLIKESANNNELRELIKKAYDEAGHTPSTLTYVDEGGNLVLTEPEWLSNTTAEQPVRKRRQFISIAAACILIMAGIVWVTERLGQNNADNSAHKSYIKKITQRSEYKYLLLPDSTQVWLNAASTLEYPKYNDTGLREVFLIGEAYFDVKHSDKQPFVIRTNKVVTVRVMGTAFNIKAYTDRDNVLVSVSRGEVRVDYNDKEVAILTEGEQVKVSNTDSMIVEKKAAISGPVPWQQGSAVYDDEELNDIIADLERIYDVKIKIEKESVRRVKISTSFKSEIGIEQALLVLCRLTDTELKVKNGAFIIQ